MPDENSRQVRFIVALTTTAFCGKRHCRLGLVLFLGLVSVNSCIVPNSYAEQSTFELRSRKNDLAPSPAPATPAQTDGQNNVLELPRVFLGCWQGRFDQPDSWQQYSGPRISAWVPTTKVLCFRHINGGVEVTYQKMTLDEEINHGEIFNVRSEAFVKGSSGNVISIVSYFSGQQYPKYLGFFKGSLVTMTATTSATLTMQPDETNMLVEASESTSCTGGSGCDGGPMTDMRWHAVFHRTDHPEGASGNTSSDQVRP